MSARALTLAVSRMRLVCAWCPTVIREGMAPESHGLCSDCKRRSLARLLEAHEFPTSLAIPRGTTERREP